MDTATRPVVRETDPDDPSIAQVYEAFAPALRRFASSRLRDPDGAQDMVQEAFVRLAIECRACHRPDDPRAWLYRVVQNLIISSARHAEVARRNAGRLTFDEADVDSPEARFLLGERSRAVRTALASAHADGRAGIILAATGYSGREIAQRIGRSEGATRTLLSRTRGSIRRELALSHADGG